VASSPTTTAKSPKKSAKSPKKSAKSPKSGTAQDILIDILHNNLMTAVKIMGTLYPKEVTEKRETACT
jgi:hypothetical protein